MAKNIKDGSDLIVYQDGTKTASGTTNTPSGSKAVANRTLPAGVDPIAYRQDYDPRGIEGYDPEADLNPEYLAQMDMNTPISGGNQSFNQYGDDSSPEMQGTRGGLNPKYRGENTKNSDVAYNPDITTKDLNPYYVYGQTSKVYGTLHPGYISQRNDNIASALYNEGRRSKEEVAQFLSQQEGWMNSSEADRLNTIESVWKRIGDIAAKDGEKPEAPEAPDLVQDTSGKLYGKTTAEEGNPKQGIDTLADANSVFKSMQEGRRVKLQDFLNQDPSVIATCLNEGTITWDEQTWRDAEQYNPAFIAEVKAEQKKQIAQKNVQAISNGGEITTAADNVDTNTQLTSYAVNNATSTTTATQLLKGIDSILESSDTAKSAQDLMGSIEKDMATLKNRLKNLRTEANTVFKGDVPEYMVNAYMSNKAQEIQNQLSILEDRYNAAYNRYKTEMSHAEWQAEYDLKKDSLALEEYKAKNPSSSTSNGNGKATMRTERNNNPTAMTTDVAKMLGGELGVDYEIGDSFTTADGKTLYTAKLIGDPIETTIRLIDRGIANGIDPFYRANGQPRWSYISKIGVNKDKWLKMSPSEKADVIAKMLQHEGGSMENMLYYVDNGGNNDASNNEWTEYDYDNFETFLDPKTNQTTVKAIASKYGYADDIKGMTELARNALKGREKPAEETTVGGTALDDASTTETIGYNPEDESYYRALLDKDYTAVSRPTETAKMLGYKDANEFMKAARAWEKATKNGETGDGGIKIPSIWVSRFGKAYNMSKYKEWDKLSVAEQQIVKGILNYQEDPTTLAKGGEANGTKNYNIRAAALAIGGDDYDVTNYQEAYKVVQLWNKANQAGGELSRNATAMDSLKDLYDIYHDSFLDRGWNNIARMPINWTAYMLGYSKTSEFNAAREIAASEVAGALKGNASPTDPEIEAAKRRLTYNNTPAQFDKVIKSYATGLMKKMASEAVSYEKVTGKKPYNMYNEYDGLLEWMTKLTNMNIADYFSDAGSYEEWEKHINGWSAQKSGTNAAPKNNAPKINKGSSGSKESSANW